ncbi:hypothetical protein D3C87_1150510 [compost metagenome]
MRGTTVGAALALVGVLLGFAFATKVDALAEAKWWDLLTAFGTVGAVVVALYFSLVAAKREHVDAQYKKTVTWTIAEAEIRVLLQGLVRASEALAKISKERTPSVDAVVAIVTGAPRESPDALEKANAALMGIADGLKLDACWAMVDRLHYLEPEKASGVAELLALLPRSTARIRAAAESQDAAFWVFVNSSAIGAVGGLARRASALLGYNLRALKLNHLDEALAQADAEDRVNPLLL